MTWYSENGDMNDVVMSTRARFARNISGYPFPPMLKAHEAEEILKLVENALLAVKSEFDFLRIDKMPEQKRLALVEKHLISPDFTGEAPRAVILSHDGTISIMVNEEDHLRIQCILPGLNPSGALDTVNKIDDLLNESLSYAFNEKYGYLTSCPTNVGTGLRISAMLHLPGINMTGGMHSLLSQAAREGIAIRGIYGEGSDAAGNLFQISNQMTLGISEEQILKRVSDAVANICEAERSMRKKLSSAENPRLTDKILRARGAMKSAYMMNGEELIDNINYVRLGIYLGIIDDTDLKTLTELMVTMSPANLSGEKTMSPEERDIYRAQLIKNAFRKGV